MHPQLLHSFIVRFPSNAGLRRRFRWSNALRHRCVKRYQTIAGFNTRLSPTDAGQLGRKDCGCESVSVEGSKPPPGLGMGSVYLWSRHGRVSLTFIHSVYHKTRLSWIELYGRGVQDDQPSSTMEVDSEYYSLTARRLSQISWVLNVVTQLVQLCGPWRK